MYKISNKAIKFTREVRKNWKVELTAGGKTFAEVKIQRVIFQEDVLLPLLFGIAMMPLKITAGNQFSKSQGKIKHLMCMDNVKLFVKNEKELETLI